VNRRLVALLAIAATVVACDQWTKHWAVATLAGRAPVNVLGEVVRFTFTRNSGVAFGLGAGTHFPYYVFSIVAAVAILILYLRRPDQSAWRRFALALILGGAIGNLIDRVSAGEVVDFIEVGVGGWHWPVFNVADSAVSVGVVLFALNWSRPGAVAPQPEDDATGESTPAGGGEGGSESSAAGAGVERGGAAGPLSRDGASEPLA
jgi:signal peptidase II